MNIQNTLKHSVRDCIGYMASLIGPKFTAKIIKALARGMTDDDFECGFGYSRQSLGTRPGHFYSVIPDMAAVRERYEELLMKPRREILGVEFNLEGQFALSSDLGPLFADFPYAFDEKSQSVRGNLNGHVARYMSDTRNRTFHLDAVVLQAMLRHFRPRRVIEVGSGYSSAVMLDTRERFGWQDQKLTFIEPYSQEYFFPLLRGDDRDFVRLIEKPLWEVDDEVFQELQSGDLLFIDSSHVAKIGSDVYHYLFDILPRLNSGVIIHIHDVTTYFEMAPEWFECGWFWNEGQFLRAFLMYNNAFEVLFHSSAMCWLYRDAPGMAELRAHRTETFKLPSTQWSNSFYFRKK
ncbi:class I SAM-dependent methyltransferase [Haliea sp. E17]|uniref:class I SAM-dependent methyltransferase n=1 Tax=Haliea sp. E17 TaxID=3401576 RepID=UPI003AAAFD0F